MATPEFCPTCGTRLLHTEFCPTCGKVFDQTPEPVAPVSRRRRSPLLILIAVVGPFLIILAVGLLIPRPGDKDSKDEPNPGDKPTAAQLSDAEYLWEHYEISAKSDCADHADDYLRSIAKYDFGWDQVGWLDAKFDRHYNVVESPGILTLVSDKAKLQNGFGAFQHILLFCKYDTQNPSDSTTFSNNPPDESP